MTPELDQQLIRHPSKFFSKLSYFECGDGWVGILTKLGDQILQLRKDGHLKHRIYATQVKEKYAHLVIYTGSVPTSAVASLDLVQGLIKEAEEESWSTCEHCGKLGSLQRIGGYWSTLCDDDYNQWLARIRPHEPPRREDPETAS